MRYTSACHFSNQRKANWSSQPRQELRWSFANCLTLRKAVKIHKPGLKTMSQPTFDLFHDVWGDQKNALIKLTKLDFSFRVTAHGERQDRGRPGVETSSHNFWSNKIAVNSLAENSLSLLHEM